jgi:hypothetical protein
LVAGLCDFKGLPDSSCLMYTMGSNKEYFTL